AFLSDFGVVKELATAGTTRTGSFVGTIAYCAPEQIEGGEVDARADQYALACVLYECLVGTSPFHAAGADRGPAAAAAALARCARSSALGSGRRVSACEVEHPGQRRRGRRPRLRVLLQGSEHGGRELGPIRARIERRFDQVRVADLGLAPSRERRRAGETLVEEAAKRVEITGLRGGGAPAQPRRAGGKGGDERPPALQPRRVRAAGGAGAAPGRRRPVVDDALV